MRFRIAIFTAVVLVGCSEPCKNTIKQEAASPDGKYVATAFIRNCGATTDFSPQVALHLAGESASQVGNIFVGDHADKIQLEWLSQTQLVVYSDCTVVWQKTNYHGITIEKRALK